MRRRPKPRYALGLFAFLVGCLINYIGDRLLGVRVELFWGLDTFNFLWFLQIFIWPVVVGIVVALLFGLGGKWLCFFPPLAVRAIAYYETYAIIGVPDGAQLMPLGWWGFFVILAMESAGIGGVIGEIWYKKTYGRSTQPLPSASEVSQAQKSEQDSGTQV